MVQRVFVVFVGCLLFHACVADQYDDLIKDIFTTSKPITNKNQQGQSLDDLIQGLDKNKDNHQQGGAGTGGGGGVTQPQYCDGGRGECVPYYLCDNNSVVTDGTGIIDIRFQEDNPCDYLSVCCGGGQTPSNPNEGAGTGGTTGGTIVTEPIRPAPKQHDGCGYRNKDGIGFKITGNTDEAEFGEFPHMVAILKEEDVLGQKLNIYQCGGSLIAPNVVLTAAHCVHTYVQAAEKLKVRAGEWDTQTKNELFPHQDRNVLGVVCHKDYYKGGLYNDIALLFIDPVDLTQDNVGVMCLPPAGYDFSHHRCFASGWGKDSYGKEGKYQVILKKIELPIVPFQTCQDSLRKTRLGARFQLHNSFVCAGGEPGKDTCKGDGGSPLICPIPGTDRYMQAGIVAWGIGCGEHGVPGVYASLSVLRNWVDEQMQANGYNSNSYTYH